MEAADREILWRQFGAAIDMLDNVLRDCPDDLWQGRLWGDPDDPWVARGFCSFWYVGYHTLFWLDYYLSGKDEEPFAPPEPFDLGELDPEGVMPRLYSRDELLTYLAWCRAKCQRTIGALSGEEAHKLCRYRWGELPYAELLLYNLRHVVEHGAQLRMFLGQEAGKAARWSIRAR